MKASVCRNNLTIGVKINVNPMIVESAEELCLDVSDNSRNLLQLTAFRLHVEIVAIYSERESCRSRS